MITRFNKYAVAAAMVFASLGAAHAEGLYAGGSLGTPDYKDNVNGISGEGSGAGGTVFGGYQVNHNFAVEGGLFNLGHIDNASGHVKLPGAYADAVGTVEVAPKLAVLGRAGVAEGRFSTTNGNDSSPALKLGAGVEYDFSQKVGLRAEYDHYRFADAFDTKPRVGEFEVGLKVGF
jgi:OOP family OmpA-OmpF porin